MATYGAGLRRGLPRTPGGEPWPPAGSAAPAGGLEDEEWMIDTAPRPDRTGAAEKTESSSLPESRESNVPSSADAVPESRPQQDVAAASRGSALRRGLPRVAGGDPWPPAGVAVSAAANDVALVPQHEPVAAPVQEPVLEPVVAAPVVAPEIAEERAVAVVRPPLEVPKTVYPGAYAFQHPEPVAPKLIRGRTRGFWAGATIGGGLGLLVAALLAVTFVQWFISLDFMRAFLTRYPGEYHLPESAKPGFPAWVQWQHYFNMFFMVLIIRTGWGVRTERRPTGFWMPKNSVKGRGKISLTLWFHQALDVLWLANGLIFVALLFVTGHWMRIVPTSWDVFPNALSALLQYVSLDWPTENGWVNYNSLQQLMYFLTVFIAAPLAALSGVRMSNFWPKKATALSKLYPVELARAIHFPVMLYFVVFIIIHVVLVFATGMLRNLNHMYAGQDVTNWVGFWIFFVGMLAVIGAWFAARPVIIASIAKLFGKVQLR